MKPSDLIAGYHTVETRDGNFWIVMLDKNQNFCFSNNNGWLSFQHDENFKYISNAMAGSKYDIVAIYGPARPDISNAVKHRTSKDSLKLVYEVVEEKELTVDQISALLGV